MARVSSIGSRPSLRRGKYETQKVEGHWRHGGVVYRDNLVRLIVDVPDSTKNRQWMRRFKSWKKRLEQHELWVVSYRIEVE
jgi:hypothetical protein